MEERAINIPTLGPDEIECRIGTIKEKGLSLLLYKDARVDQRMLDRIFGPFNWKREHEAIDGSVYCAVSVRDPDTGEWIRKQDVGSSSGQTEREKSLASDSFKRACVNWGIGRELYTAPFIWIPAERTRIYRSGNKLCCDDRFRVAEIGYGSARVIRSLVVENQAGERAFVWSRKASGSAGNQTRTGITKSQKSALKAELRRTGVTMAAVNERFHVDDPDEMSPKVYAELMKALANTKTRAA